ncbi:hypothetical protein D3C86_1677470 [compost metagenome]
MGVISPKIRMTMVSSTVEMAMPASPHRSTAITVAIEAARMLTTLLPTRMVPSRRSGRSSRSLARRAPLCPSRTR